MARGLRMDWCAHHHSTTHVRRSALGARSTAGPVRAWLRVTEAIVPGTGRLAREVVGGRAGEPPDAIYLVTRRSARYNDTFVEVVPATD